MRSIPSILLVACLAAIPMAAWADVDAEGPAALKVKGSILPEGDVDVFRFDADAGTLLTFKLGGLKKAPLAFDPVLVGPGEETVSLAAAKVKGSKFSVAKLPLPSSGAYRLEVGGSGTGDYSLSLKAKVKGLKTLKLDVRAASLGRPDGGEVFLRRVLGAAGGALEVDDPGSDMDGAILTLPPGAVADGTPVVLASARAPAAGDFQRILAGPAAVVGPADLDLGAGATLALPYDPELLPADATPVELEFLAAPAGGAAGLAAPEALDEEGGFVTAAAAGPGLLVPVIRYGLPRLEGGGGAYWFLSFYTEHQQSGDSRDRTATLSIGSLLFGPGTLDASMQEYAINWSNIGDFDGETFTGFDADVHHQTYASGDSLGWSWGPGGIVVLSEEDAPVFLPSRDGSVLVGRLAGDGLPSTSMDLAIRKMAGTVALADLAGTWQWGGIAREARASGNPQAPASLYGGRMFGTLTVQAGGKVVLKGAEYGVETDEGTQSMREETGSFSFTGTASVEAGGTLLMNFGAGDQGPPVLRGYPGRDGGAMFVVPASFDGQSLLGIVALRQASGMKPGELAGDWKGGGWGTDPLTMYYDGFPVPDFSAGCERLDVSIADDGRSFSVDMDGRQVRRNGETGGLDVETADESATLPLSLAGSGKMTLSDTDGGRLVGAASDDGQVMFFVTDPTRKGGDLFLGVVVRKP